LKNQKKETKFQEPAGTGGHKTAKDNRRTIDTTDWELAEKKLQENMKRAKGLLTQSHILITKYKNRKQSAITVSPVAKNSSQQ